MVRTESACPLLISAAAHWVGDEAEKEGCVHPVPVPVLPDGDRRAHRQSARDAADAAAADADRGSWAEALPSMRAAWEEHEDRYPERERATPLTQMDGSWSSGETRRLTPGQNAEATKACADIHDEGERVVFPAMLQIEAADPDRRLVGVEHMLKGQDRLKEKISDALRA